MLIHFVFLTVALLGCGVVADDCENRCGTFDLNAYTCQCNSECSRYGNCCADYATRCLGTGDSCVNRECVGHDYAYSCQCNSFCTQYNDCCADYQEVCHSSTSDSCANRCDSPNDASKTCQCNSYCGQYGDCCPDYNDHCTTDTGGGGSSSCPSISVTNDEILAASLNLWDLNTNNAQEGQIIYDLQGQTSQNANDDVAPEPFFTYVDETIFNLPTFQKLLALQDNYEKYQGITETVTTTETDEESDFLDAVLDTAVGQYLFEFLNSKNLAGCNGISGFKQILSDVWFGMYDRQAVHDTSGFEHSFVGEIKGSGVSGFHNWVHFYNEELRGNFNYQGFLSTQTPDIVGMRQTWYGATKPINGFTIGTSPEIELALFSLCHLAKPDSRCNIKMRNGDNVEVLRSIQTWKWGGETAPGNQYYVASAYFLS